MSTWSLRDPDDRVTYRNVGILRHLAILRTNRQIYIEASYILCSELRIRIKAGHENPRNSNTIWRHDPCYDRGAVDKNGNYVYNTPELAGPLEPHVFARLRKIQYDALLPFPTAPTVSFKEDFSMELHLQVYYMGYIHEASVEYIQRFVACISHSPIINHLDVNFGVRVSHFRMPNEEVFFDTEAFEEMSLAANRQARDMFVHCGVLGPLRALHNVRSFNLGFFQEEKMEGFPVWLAELAKDIKLTVERNLWPEQDANRNCIWYAWTTL